MLSGARVEYRIITSLNLIVFARQIFTYAIVFFRLKMYVNASSDDVKVFMKAEGRKANSVR